MKTLNDFLEIYENGKPTFLKLFNMPKEQLLKTLKDICGTKVSNDMFEMNSRVSKYIEDDEPEKIEIHIWDSLEISPFGIKYKKEHTYSETIVEFNKYFTL